MPVPRAPFRNVFLFCILLMTVLTAVSFACQTHAHADQQSEHYKILALLNKISASNLVFIRNGVPYTGEEASSHLREKLKNFSDQIYTAEDFINAIASQSSVTGFPYYVRLADGTKMEARIWLREQLAVMK